MRIVCISDTHLEHPDIPDGDVLLHAGDATFQGRPEEIRTFNAWFAALPHRHKVFVAGNHDWGFQKEPEEALKNFRQCVKVNPKFADAYHQMGHVLHAQGKLAEAEKTFTEAINVSPRGE